MSVGYITEHFPWLEWACHDGTPVPQSLQPNVRRLCQTVLEPIRARWGGPIIVVSGYRTPAYNTAIGGAPRSQHVAGTAADIRPVILERVNDLRALVDDLIRDGELPELGGFGVYKTWLHVDVRQRVPSNHIARWTGTGVGSEPA